MSPVQQKTKIVADVASLGTTVRLSTRAARVVVTAGPEKGRVFSLPAGETLTVGTDPANALPLSDPTVSRRHASVSLLDGGVRVTDLDSTNGTFFEGSRLRSLDVPFGATVSVGKTQLKVLPEEESVELGPAASDRFGGMLGQDRRMREIFALLADVAPTDTTVLIEGETGTGKEVVARAIHDASKRRGKPLVVFDCSAVPGNLVESALFGHVRGAFTGAAGARAGAFRSAHGGTLFLDEIGELPLELQPKLLRALESRTVQAVGSDTYEKTDVRVVAATNRSLKAEVRGGRFREDLYYRLAVVKVILPSLRERMGDLPLLVGHFVQQALGRPRALDPRGLTALESHGFPGNVRELKNLVDRALALSPGNAPLDLGQVLLEQERDDARDAAPRRAVTPSSTPAVAPALPTAPTAPTVPTVPAPELVDMAPNAAARPPASGTTALISAPARAVAAGAPDVDASLGLPFKDAKQQVMDAFEKRYLAALLERCMGNLSRAAATAQLDRKHLRELLKKHGLWQGAEEA